MKDAIVIGGGPAGCSAALGLRRRGFAVTLVEQRTAWVGRVCGAFLDPHAVAALDTLGVLPLIRDAGAAPVTRIAVHLPSGDPTVIDLKGERGSGLALHRHALEDRLLDAAREAGVTVEMGTRALAAQPEGEGFVLSLRDKHAAQRRERTALAVLADGRFTVGIPATIKPRQGWFGWNADFAGVRQAPGTLSMHFYPCGYIGVLTFADGLSNICGLSFYSSGQIEPWEKVWSENLDRMPALRDLVHGAERQGDWRGVGPLPFSENLRETSGVLAVGDAAAVGDPFMGEGIGRALSAGPLLMVSLDAAGGPAATPAAIMKSYAGFWTERFGKRLGLGIWARRMLERPLLFNTTMRHLLKRPHLLEGLIPALHPPAAPLAPAR